MTAPLLKPHGAPQGVDPMEWRKSVEARLNDYLDRAMALITALDMMEVDPDFEETGDKEPSLGWPEHRGSCQLARDCPSDDREVEDEHGGDINDEAHDDDEREPFLGWSEKWGQGRRGVVIMSVYDFDAEESA